MFSIIYVYIFCKSAAAAAIELALSFDSTRIVQIIAI